MPQQQPSTNYTGDQMEYKNLIQVIDTISKLRNPIGGSPWDLKQDHQTLLKYLIEESYEYIHAVEKGDSKKMEEELGDVFLQVLLHCQIASETNKFSLDSISKALNDKMVYRHPHVFKKDFASLTASEVQVNWKALKEKKALSSPHHITDEDAYAPALKASEIIGAKSQEINFDWDHISDVMAKVEEELQEVKDEMLHMRSKKNLFEEIGDLLFSVAQLSRHLGIEPEEALKEANLKFIKRVSMVEDKVRDDGFKMTELSTKTLEDYWAKVKVELSAAQE